MGSDMLVALQEASAHHAALFGANHYAPIGRRFALRLLHGSMHEHEICPPLPANEMLQTRPVCTVLGLQEAGQWGFVQGFNEHHVAIGAAPWRSRLANPEKGLFGADLVRIVLERSHSCTQAVDTLANLISRYGQRGFDADGPADNVFLVADGHEAYVVEAAGNHWAMLECSRSRAVNDVAFIRQDWHRISPGLADWAIEHSLWDDDGSKLDFLGAVGLNTPAQALARRRWGRTSVALAQQDGAIDPYFLRRMLADQFDVNHDLLPNPHETTLAGTIVAGLSCDAEPVIWFAFGAPQVSLFFPIALAGELPLEFSAGHPENPSIQQCVQQLSDLRDPERRNDREAALMGLQERFDRDAETFVAQAALLRQRRDGASARHLATEMMHKHVKAFEAEWRSFCAAEKFAAPVEEEMEMVPFAF
jgi:hypothetical protein